MTSSGSSSASTNDRRWIMRAVFIALGVLAFLFVVSVATLMFGAVSGQEFSPQTFTRRSFFYYQVPLLGAQVSPITRDNQTNSLENYLSAERLVTGAQSKEQRWDLVYTTSGGGNLVEGDAGILCTYLDAKGEDGTLYWEAWSKENPELAKILWPVVSRIACQQLYMFTPEMIELAKRARDPARFQQRLHQTAAGQYLRLAEIQQQLANHGAAAKLLAEALTYTPDDPLLKQRHAAASEAAAAQSQSPGDEAE
jgi:hypothetical protein